MVALLIKIGGFLFNGALGIRFMTLILNALSIQVIWQLIPEKNKTQDKLVWLFFGILLAIPLFHVYSFLTTPDAPLLFFVALYLLAYKKMTAHNSLSHALLWGFTAAMLIYSKYHGGVFILLSVVLQPKLLQKRNTYIAGLFALIILSPHIIWQYKHDFITFQYHLFQRTDGHFKLSQVLDYVGGTLGVLNPGFLIVLLILFLKHKRITYNQTDRFYLQLSLSFLLFFFFYSFRSRIEAHWVAAAYVPLSIVLYNLYVQNNHIRKGMRIIIYVSVFLLFLTRILLVSGIKIKNLFIPDEAAVYSSIANRAKNRTVVFRNSYQKASKYHFYTGKRAWSYNDIYYRKNQYDLFLWATECHAKKAMVFDYKKDSIVLPNQQIWYYKDIDRLPVFTQLKAHFIKPDLPFKPGKTYHISIYNPYPYTIYLNDKELRYQFALLFRHYKEYYIVPLQSRMQKIASKETMELPVKIGKLAIPDGEYKVDIVLKPYFLNYQSLSTKPLEISFGVEE